MSHFKPSMQAAHEAIQISTILCYVRHFFSNKVTHWQQLPHIQAEMHQILQPKKKKKNSEQTNKSSVMTRGRVGGHESAEYKPMPPWSSQHFS